MVKNPNKVYTDCNQQSDLTFTCTCTLIQTINNDKHTGIIFSSD